MADHLIKGFKSGTHNLIDSEAIPSDAAKDSLNWLTSNGRIELSRGKEFYGGEGTIGKVYNLHFGTRNNGNLVLFEKVDTKIRYYNTTTGLWVDVVTGLTSTALYSFSNYTSLAGNFTYATGIDGIYKIHNANPGSYIDMYASTRNFKGLSFIDKARMIMWGLATDRTGLYGGYIDAQNSTVYTTVSLESLGSATGSSQNITGTLAFKSGQPLRTCFGLEIFVNSVSVAKDDYNGNITASTALPITGTINYTTGDYDITLTGGSGHAIQVTYQWENSNEKGITDFRKSSTRLAGEGFIVRQDEGGDAIQSVLIGQDGSYYSLKKSTAYQFTMDATDTNPTNVVYRKDIGIKTPTAAVSTGSGIIFMNTANPEKPYLTVLQRNPLGDNIEPVKLFIHYDFSKYNYDDVVVDTWGKYVIIACKQLNSTENDRLLLCDLETNSVDATYYNAQCFAKGSDGRLYAGSPFTQSVQVLFIGFDDDGSVIDNFWESKDEDYGSERLKKYRRLRLKGLIDQFNYTEVYASYDLQGYQLIGTVRGDAEYVDVNSPQTIGTSMVAEQQVGGDAPSESLVVYPYYMQIKVKVPKFKTRSLKFVSRSIGYVSIEDTSDFDILSFEQRIPKKFRQKQNVNLAGTETDMANPQF